MIKAQVTIKIGQANYERKLNRTSRNGKKWNNVIIIKTKLYLKQPKLDSISAAEITVI